MINEQLTGLRSAMREQGLDAVIFPSNDPHQSEYVADYWKIRAHFSGFHGSAGTLVVTQNEAALWTDSRYFLEVEQDCQGTEVTLHKQTIPHAPEHVKWLCDLLPKGSIIGHDYRLLSYGMKEYIDSFIQPKSIQLVDIPDLVEGLWNNRPEPQRAPIVDHPVDYCGESRETKIARVHQLLEKENADCLFISRLDEIVWLLNIRSTDVDFTPLVTGYVLVNSEQTYLFSSHDRFDAALLEAMEQANVSILPYEAIASSLHELTQSKKVIADRDSLNYACYASIAGELIYQPSALGTWKTVKNSVEIENTKNGMLKDGVALVKFFHWLEAYLENNTISEYELGKKLESFRKEQPLYRGESFAAIVGYQGNGAIIHYTAPENGSATIRNEGILLLDSGAQYENATTDITRTIWLGGIPSNAIKKAYTLVLKGYIALETLQFPKSLTGMQLDSFARMHLWQHGLDYGHGTGHGIGAYSMVHEPGQGFSASGTNTRGTLTHLPQQFTSIEPGFYQTGAFGIRTENIVVSKVVEETSFGEFLGFEALTLCPIETRLIDDSLFTQAEKDWLNNYHARVFDTLKTSLSAEESAWLKERCNPL